jgi:hypothetical protein
MVFAIAGRLLRAPTLYRLSARLGRLLQRFFLRPGRLRDLPLLGEWMRTRDLPAIAPRTFSERWGELREEGRR